MITRFFQDVNINTVAPIIQVENIAKVYRIGKVEVPALRGVSFEVQPGEFVSIDRKSVV